VRAGIKLNIGFSEDELCRQLYGDRDILGFLRKCGIDAVETPIRPTTDDSRLFDHVRLCNDAGFRVSVHPYTEGKPSNPGLFSMDVGNPCRTMHERFLGLAAETAAIQQAETVINIHPAAGGRDISRPMLVQQSIRFFSWAQEWCIAHAAGVHPTAELQIRPDSDEPIQRTGDTYSELLHIAQNSGTDVCWDFGHAFMNARRFGLPLDPPAELQALVAHVHCHDANTDDHQPLLFGNVPWKRFLNSLTDNGFDGTVILEVPPRHCLSVGGIEGLEQSLRSMVERIETSRANTQNGSQV